MATLVAEHYGQEVAALVKDPIIVAMAVGLKGVPKDELAHADGTPRFTFMLAANKEFASRGGKGAGSMGSVARALLALLGDA